MKNRAVRRHHLDRMKEKAKKIYYFNSPEQAIKLANHLANCSCWMCGHRRAIEGPNIQERRERIRINETIES